jgi:hypothetical protein
VKWKAFIQKTPLVLLERHFKAATRVKLNRRPNQKGKTTQQQPFLTTTGLTARVAVGVATAAVAAVVGAAIMLEDGLTAETGAA